MAQVYRFGPFTLDTGRRRLFRHGEALTVPPKALDVLHLLLDNRGRTVDKGDLMSRVWPDAIVEEANLTQSVFVLRRALGDERRIRGMSPPSPAGGIDSSAACQRQEVSPS